MATQNLRVYSGKEILLAYYNRSFGRNVQLNEIQFDTPRRVDTPGTNFNTSINLYPNLGTRYYGSPKLNYDRVHISLLGTIVITKGQATRVHDLLDAINLKYNINLTGDDVENDLLDPFTTGDITVNLRVKEDSVMFYAGEMIYTPAYPDPNNGVQPVVDQYAFWSPTSSSPVVVLSNNNYTALMNNEHLAITQMPITGGRIYWEVKIDAEGLLIGVALPSAPRTVTGGPVAGNNAQTWVLNTVNGKLYHDSAEFSYTAPQLVAGMTVGVLLDYSAGTLSFMVGNNVVGTAFTGLNAHNELYPIIAGATTLNARGTANFGEFPFTYVPPVDYKKGLFTLVQSGTGTPPPPSGGPATNLPAGTILSTLCQDEDKWNVVADGTGKFVFVLAEADSADCGYDPNNPPVYYGGDSTSGGIGKPTLSAVGGPFMMNEDSPFNIPYALTTSLAASLVLNFEVVYGSASAADITSFEYRMSNQPSWTTIVSGEQLIVPAGITNFSIRITPVADQLTEGLETLSLVIGEVNLGEFLSNNASLNTAIVITDSSTNPIPYPVNPAPIAGWDAEYSTNFEQDNLSSFVLEQSIPGSSVAYVDGSGEPSHMRFLSVASGNADDLNRLDLTTEATASRRKSINVQMKVSVSQTDVSNGAGFGITLFDLFQNPDPDNNNGTQLRLIAPTTGASNAAFRAVQTQAGQLAQHAASLLVPSTIHTVGFRVYAHTAGWYLEYWLDGTMQARLDVGFDVLGENLDFKVGLSAFGNTQVKIYTVNYSSRPLLVPRTVRLQGAGQFTIPAGQMTISLAGRGGAGVNNPFTIDRVLTNRVHKMHRGNPSLASGAFEKIVKLGSKYFAFTFSAAGRFFVGNDLDSFTIPQEGIYVKEAVPWKDKLYIRFHTQTSAYQPDRLYTTTDGETFTEVPNLIFIPRNYEMIKAFDDQLFVGNEINTFTTVDGQNWTALGRPYEVLLDTGAGYMDFQAGNTIFTTSDGQAWNQATNIPNGLFSPPVAGNGVVAYISLEDTRDIVYTTDTGQTWQKFTLPNPVNALFYCNGIFAARSPSADGIYWGTSIPEMVFMGREMTDGGYIANPEYIQVVKNRFVCRAQDENVRLISSTLRDWIAIPTNGVSNFGDDHFDLDDLVAFRAGTGLNSSLYSLISFETEESLAETAQGIVGAECEVTMDSTTYEFPISSSSNLPTKRTTTVDTNVAQPVVFDYIAPVGTALEVTFLDQPYQGVPIDTPITQNCENLDVVDRFADGNGGEYMEIVSRNSATCGYIADTPKEATLVGQGVVTIPPGTSEITVHGRGSSFTPAVFAEATAPIPLNVDHIVLPDGYRAFSIAYGNGMYVATGYIDDVDNFYIYRAFYSPDLRNWTASSITLYEQGWGIRVGFAINTFYLAGGYTRYKSTTGMDDWVTTSVSLQFGSMVSIAGLTLQHNLGSSAAQYSFTTDGDNWSTTPIYYSHETTGLLQNGSRIVSYGRGSQSFQNVNFIRSTVNGTTWLGHPIANFTHGLSTDYKIDQMVYHNGVYFGLMRENTYNAQFAYRGYVSGTTLDNLTFTSIDPLLYVLPKLLTVGNNIVIFDGNKIYYGTDGQNWTTVTLDHNDFLGAVTIGNVFAAAALRSFAMPGFLLVRSIATGQQYVSKRAQLGQPAVVAVGTKIKTYPGNYLDTALATVVDTTYTIDPGNETTIVYDCPPGSSVKINYLAVADNNPVSGTLLNEICDGFNKVGVYANGFGGTYQQTIAVNDASCGYTPPVLRAELSAGPTSLSVLEGSSGFINYTLSQPLDVDVTFQLSIDHTSATADDYTNFMLVQGGVETPMAVGDEVTLTAGQTSFAVKFDAATDGNDETDELFDINFTPTVNANRILNTVATTTVTINNLKFIVQPTQYSYDVTNGDTRFNSGAVVGLAMTDRGGVMATEFVNSIDKFYVPLGSVNLKRTIVGFGTTASMVYDDGNYVYPGMDTESWGITEGGYWHGGTFTPIASSWNFEETGILLDRINGTMDLVIDGTPQNYGITGMPTTGSLRLMVGALDTAFSAQGFYTELSKDGVFTYTPPAGYKQGFGEVVSELNYIEPQQAPATGVLDPALFTGRMTDGRGSIMVDSSISIVSDKSVSDGIWYAEIWDLSGKPFRFGVCNSSFSTSNKVGDDANSWGITSDLLSTFVNGVETAIPDGNRSSTNHVIRIEVDLFNNRVRVLGGGGDWLVVFQDMLTGPLYLAFSTDEALATGGQRLYVNTGMRLYNNGYDNANPGFGTYIGTPQDGVPISTFCDGTELKGIYHDGNGGTREDIVDGYSFKCGYVPPAPALVGWDTATLPAGWVVKEPGHLMELSNVDGYAYSYTTHGSGKHYWEFNNADSQLVVGFASDQHDPEAAAFGDDPYSIRIHLDGGGITQTSNYYDDIDVDFYDEIYGKSVGFMLDQDLGKLYLKYQSGTVKEITSYTALTGNVRVVLWARWGFTSPEIYANLGQVPFQVVTMPAGYTQWFTP